MRYFSAFIHAMLLIVTPTALLYPQDTHPQVTLPTQTENSRLLSYDEIITLLDELDSGELEKKCSLEELDRINHFLVHLAREGLLPDGSDDDLVLEEDARELLGEDTNPFEYAFSSDEAMYIPAIFHGEREIILCKGWIHKKWNHAKKFAKNHKKEILIGSAIFVATAVVVVAVVVISSAGTAAAIAGAAGGVVASANQEEKSAPPPQEKPEALPPVNEMPILQSAIDEHISSFKEKIVEEKIFQSFDISPNEATFGEKAREFGAFLAHETLDEISEVVLVVPQLLEEVVDTGRRMIPERVLSPSSGSEITPMENHEHFVAKGHQVIDQVFATDQAGHYTPEAKANDPRSDFSIGILPPPGSLPKGLSGSKFKQVIGAGKETAALAEELGFTAREITQLEKAGALEKSVGSTFEKVVSDKAMLDSVEKFNQAKDFLKSYSGKYMPEAHVKELIHQTGVRTFPRPAGIPENYRVRLSKNRAGIKYVHPENTHMSVRIMPGKPHSPFPYQREPYVIQKIDGKALDKFGNKVSKKAPEAHIPLEEFIYRSK